MSKDDDIVSPVVLGRDEPGDCSLADAHTRTGEFGQKDNRDALAGFGSSAAGRGAQAEGSACD
jgi:hypothetical protein